MPHTGALSENVEEYLEAIHRLAERPGGASTTSLARHLRITPASVTGMLRRLRELGMISYRRYHDIALTEDGQRRAHDLIRRHRLAERLLTDVLKVPLDEAHQEACRLEHVMSPRLEQRMADALGSPVFCPHGHPMDLDAADAAVSLLDAPLGVDLVIARLDNESPDVVRHLSERALVPGAQVIVKQRDLTAGTVVVEASGETHTLGVSIAETVCVRSPWRKQ
ncbi:MAG: metal-dependent transcriptional regulator [Armatimonadota bacterium]|jgi:DtxR family Mn-dependent transcriptional regulator